MGGPVITLPDTGTILDDITRRLRQIETAPIVRFLRFDESVDATHALYVDVVIPNGVKVKVARLSWKRRLYRSTSSFAGGATGGQSASHTHGSAGHNHGLAIAVGPSGVNVLSLTAGPLNSSSGPWTDTSTVMNTTPGSTGVNSVDHTHSVGSSSLGVGEGTSSTIASILVDGVDKTSVLVPAGPWAGDVIDLDLAAVMPAGDGLWHEIRLVPAAQGRFVGTFKFSPGA